MELKRAPKELWKHEAELYMQDILKDITHDGSPNLWLSAASGISREETKEEERDFEDVLIYRHMGDKELDFLVKNNRLPDTQPYQTITRGEEGRAYCMSYLRGRKYVDTNPTCIIEFNCRKVAHLRFLSFFCFVFLFFSMVLFRLKASLPGDDRKFLAETAESRGWLR